MKKFFGVILAVIMVVSCVMSVSAEDTTAAKYSFGEIEGELVPGENITLPVYFDLGDIKINTVVFQMKFDEEQLEFTGYEKSDEHTMSSYNVGITSNDSSKIGAAIYDLKVNKAYTLNNVILVKFNFKIKDTAENKDVAFDIVKSEVSSLDGFFSEEFEYEQATVCIEKNTDSSVSETEKEDEENSDDSEENNDGNTVDEDLDESDSSDEDELIDNSTVENNTSGEKKENESSNGSSNKPVKEENKPEVITPEFSDLTGYEWAKDYIIPLAAKGIIKGTSDSTFSPANNITRADFMVLLMRLLEITGTETNGFADVPADSYFAGAVTSAKELGIAKGGSDGNFKPYDSITREDLCVLVYRALTGVGYLPVVPNDGSFTKKFSDVEEISDYAFDAMRELYLNEIIGGSDGMVNPKGFATRAETAVIMYRISKLIPEL